MGLLTMLLCNELLSANFIAISEAQILVMGLIFFVAAQFAS